MAKATIPWILIPLPFVRDPPPHGGPEDPGLYNARVLLSREIR